ncbi:tigger transposable element-derived protein 1 [Trichonephila clavipes]|nr:tigger transposable element-derived protein 1 [Trichonephila clavipes]
MLVSRSDLVERRQSVGLYIDRLGKEEGSTAIGKHFNLGEPTVRAIKKNEAAIRKSVISGTKLSTKFASYTRDVLLERTERAIAIWIEEQVQRRIPVSGYLIQEKALNETCATADEGGAKIFPEELAKIIEHGDYSADQVFNADETGLYWKKLPNRTYIAKDEKTASEHKASKDRVTLLLCSNASGDRMLKPLLINKSLRPRALKENESKTVKDVWKQFSIFDCLIHVASASAQIRPTILNACWKKIWPACVTDNTTTQTSTLSDEIITLAHEIGGDGFNTFSHNDVDKLLVGDALSDNDIIDLTLDLTVDGVVGLEESSSQSLITDDIVRKGRATQNENEVCENPWPLPQISIAETVSSDDGDLEPLRKRCKPLSDSDLSDSDND